AHHVFEQLEILTRATAAFTERCVRGLKADEPRCRHYLERSLGLVTALAPSLGYGRAAALAEESQRTGRSVRELVLEHGWLTAEELDRLLAPEAMADAANN